MEASVVVFIILACMKVTIRCVPINQGLSAFDSKFREESIPKTFRVPEPESKSTPGPTAAPPTTVTLEEIMYPRLLTRQRLNQMGKVVFPSRVANTGGPPPVPASSNFLNLPIVAQPYVNNYQVLVVTAPPQLKLNNEESKPLVIYVVFSDDHTDDTGKLKFPTVYFVHKKNFVNEHKVEKADPVIIVDNNRTVTGLKSNTIARSIKFKTKFLDQLYYETTNGTNSSA